MNQKRKNTSTGQEFVLYGSWDEFAHIAATRKDLWVICVTAMADGKIGAVFEPHIRAPNRSDSQGTED